MNPYLHPSPKSKKNVCLAGTMKWNEPIQVSFNYTYNNNNFYKDLKFSLTSEPFYPFIVCNYKQTKFVNLNVYRYYGLIIK